VKPIEPPGAPGLSAANTPSGEFVDVDGERCYVIRNVDRMPPFFMSVISSADHWLFVSSTGGLTAGRISPERALFPYVTVDKIHESSPHTGCRTLFAVDVQGQRRTWEPFRANDGAGSDVTRNLYKSVLCDRVRFEEINRELGLAFRYTWGTSERHGFVRSCEIENLGEAPVAIELIDGLQNILPAGTPAIIQASSSNLADAYKWTELHEETRLAMYALYSGISDRAEPCESLRANVVYGLGLPNSSVLLSSRQLDGFLHGRRPVTETRSRGIRGAYFVHATLSLPRRGTQRWRIVADIEKTQAEVVALTRELRDPARAESAVAEAVEQGRAELARIVASADGFQSTAEEAVTAHHYANVLFNVLRGGTFWDQYAVPVADFAGYLHHFNRRVHARHGDFLAGLPERIPLGTLRAAVKQAGDAQLERLCLDYLPLTFGRRHGDPSRPWNRFSIRVRDEAGNRRLSYEGNWRDIFQNWEALALSFPEFVESVVARFVNASTVDGYNPYRITRQGIDWEVEEPENPWSHIGYWGDHQIIYLLKLLELSRRFHPARLRELLRLQVFSYADVPYRIRSFAEIVADPKNTVVFDQALDARIAERVRGMGADGRLVRDAAGDVYLVNLLEKLLVPLLAKLGNLVVDGGIWLNTQRPEWNDANNALVGHGLSMVTLYYLRRYLRFLRELLDGEAGTVALSAPVARWLAETADALAGIRPLLATATIGNEDRWQSMRALGVASERYRTAAYAGLASSPPRKQPLAGVASLLEHALAVVDHSIAANRSDRGSYHSYNLLDLRPGGAGVDRLYLMLEGQVAALSSGAVTPAEAADLLEALFDSDIYRPDQRSFLLYPDRPLPGFLEKNRVPADAVERIPLLRQMTGTGDDRLVVRDADGGYRFSADFTNVRDLQARLDELAASLGTEVVAARQPVLELYERVFRHREYTGRSGSMFGFEGLGCIYWHMVSKLLLAVQENFFLAVDQGADPATCRRLGQLYYRVREGLGFNKSPSEYGAFPTDPYSHTPGHSGAQQPGMTGQVKEEVLSRFGELGLRVSGGEVRFDPRLLRAGEFAGQPQRFRYLDVDGRWQEIGVPAPGLAFTWCQVPVVYQLLRDDSPRVTITGRDGSVATHAGLALPSGAGADVFTRSGRIRSVSVGIPQSLLLAV
jgi:hypothetical protein